MAVIGPVDEFIDDVVVNLEGQHMSYHFDVE